MSTPAKVTSFSLVMVLLCAGLIACNRSNQASALANGNPENGNLAPVDQSNYTAQNYAQPPESSASAPQNYSQPTYAEPAYNQPAYEPYSAAPQYSAPPAYSDAPYEPVVEATEPPPPLVYYSQPPCPGEDYIWTPGYWAYSNAGYDVGYYWVPGAWVLAPWVGALWTPPWWGFDNGAYLFHTGYWGPHIGFYGGIDYGFGYTGRGYYGAYWDHDRVRYNRAVTNVDPPVVNNNIYSYGVPNQYRGGASYNGGRGGINARPTPQELAVASDPRTGPVPAQIQQARQMAANRAQFAVAGQPHPAAVAANRPLATNYRAPAPHPPPAAMRAAQLARTAPGHPTTAPNLTNDARAGAPVAPQAVPQNRAAPQQQPQPGLASAGRGYQKIPQFGVPRAQPFSQTRPPVAGNRAPMPPQFGRPGAQPAPLSHPPVVAQRGAQPTPQQMQRPQAPVFPQRGPGVAQRENAPATTHPSPAAPARPAPQAQPAFQPRPAPALQQARPAFQPRPAPAPQAQPAFQPHSAPAPQQARPAFQPHPAPASQARPAFQPRPAPAPQARAQAAPHPAPVAQAQPHPQAGPRPPEKR